jgi:hypothetical protein
MALKESCVLASTPSTWGPFGACCSSFVSFFPFSSFFLSFSVFFASFARFFSSSFAFFAASFSAFAA